MLGKLADLVAERPLAAAGVALVTIAVCVAIGVGTPERLALGGFADSGSESAEVSAELEAELGYDPKADMVIFTRGADKVRSGPYRVALEAIGARLRSDPAVAAVRRGPVSADGRSTALEVFFGEVSGTEGERAARRLERGIDPGPLRILVGGPVPELVAGRDTVQSDLADLELLVAPLAALLLLAGFGLRMLPGLLIAAAIAVFGSLALLRLADAAWEVWLPGAVAAVGMAGVVSIEACHAFVLRYRAEAWIWGHGPEALRHTVPASIRGVTAASLGAAAAMGSLWLVPLGYAHSAALGGVLGALLAGAAALMVMPPLLEFWGPRMRPRRLPGSTALEGILPGERPGIAYRLGSLVAWNPISSGAIAALATIALLVLAIPATSTGAVGFSASELPSRAEPRRAEAALDRALGPGVGEPLLVVAERPSRSELAGYMGRLAALSAGGELTAISAPRPLGGGRRMIAIRLADDPATLAGQRQARLVRNIDSGFPAKAGGAGADPLDAARGVRDSIPLAVPAAIALSALVLLLVIRAPSVAFAAALATILPVAAIAGLLVLVFGDGLLTGSLDYRSRGAPELSALVLAVGLLGGMLMARGGLLAATAAPERDREERSVAAARATALSAPAAAVSLVVALAAAAAAGSDLLGLRELGIALAAGLLLDLVAVRLLLAPGLFRALPGRPKGVRLPRLHAHGRLARIRERLRRVQLARIRDRLRRGP